MAAVAKGTPLSVRIARGRPYPPERALEDGLGQFACGGAQPVTREQNPRRGIGHRLRSAVRVIAGAELAP